MVYGLYLSAAGMQAQEYRQNVTANNIANSQTTGFKRDLAMIQSRLEATHEDPTMRQYRVPVYSDQGGGVLAMPTLMDMSQGILTPSHNDKDLALKGSGFFTLQGDNAGEKLLTRDGHFKVNADGNLVAAASGRNVLDADGNPIKLTNPALPLTVDGTGQISQLKTIFGKIGVVDVKDPADLQKVGQNLLTVDQKSLEPATTATEVRQGYLEASDVDPIMEMTNMMQNQRAYEANAKMITYQDTALQLLSTVGRIS